MDEIRTYGMILFIFFLCMAAFTQEMPGIEFTFENIEVTHENTDSLEFDVMVRATEEGTSLGDNMVYINYNPAGFGYSVVTNGKIRVVFGTAFSGSYVFIPSDTRAVDNSPTRFSVTINYDEGDPYALLTTPTILIHVSIEISDPSETAGLSFENSYMTGEQFDIDFNAYDPVIATDTDDSALPVELSSFSATYQNGYVNLTWRTASEVNTKGFNVLRSKSRTKNYELINPQPIESAGNSTFPKDYTYTDFTVPNFGLVYYKLESINVNGVSGFFGPVSVAIEGFASNSLQRPTSYYLAPNFPNPFNPETTIVYGLPEENHVIIAIFNLLGEEMIKLVDQQKREGYHTITWNGMDKQGRMLTSGLYLLRLTAGNKVLIQKINILR